MDNMYNKLISILYKIYSSRRVGVKQKMAVDNVVKGEARRQRESIKF